MTGQPASTRSNAYENHDRNGFSPHAACNAECQVAGRAATAPQRRTVLQFSASDEFMAKLEKVRSLAWHRLPANTSLERVFELALDLVIEKNDPARRRERRARREQATACRNKTEKAEQKTALPRTESRASTTVTDVRYIAPVVRDRVYVRDGERCTFTGPKGRRCGSVRALQIDHVTPVALGGKGTEESLRVLCAYHNRLEAERLLGTGIGRAGPKQR